MTPEDEAEILRIIELDERVEFRRRAGDVERSAWVAAARQIFAPGERQACHVCGKFRSIAQAHHIVPLTAQYDRGFKYPDQEHVWLCPNHHTMVHLYIPADDRSMSTTAVRARTRTTGALNDDLTNDEFDRLLDLMGRSLRGPK